MTQEERLTAFAVFDGIAVSTRDALLARAERRSWAAGTVMFLRGDAEDHLLALTSGRVRLSLTTPQGRELVLRIAGPGETLGELALIDGQPRSADATALEPVTALVLRRSAFLEICAAHPDLALAMARYLCRHVRNTNHQIESIALYDLQTRLLRFLLFTLHQEQGDDLPARATLRLGLTQNDLSNVLGASRPKVNQALQALITAGVLEKDDTGLICDVPQMEALVEDFEAR